MSQAPTTSDEPITEGYVSAWDATRILTIQKGRSWSGSERNHLFLNIGDGHFADVSMVSACNCIGDGRAVATLDWDDDGKLDFVLKNRTGPRLQLFQNRYSGDNNFLVLELKGNGTSSNRDAIGAHVEARLANGTTLHSTLRSSDGFLAQSSKRIHLGLGDADGVEELTIVWPDGSRSVHADLPAGQRLRIVQDGGGPEPLAPQAIPAMAKLRPRPFEPEKTVTRAVLASQLPMSAVPLPGYDHPERTVADLAGRPILINLWQRTCVACFREFFEFKQRAADIRASRLLIVPINADTKADVDETRKRIAEYDLAHDAGIWNEEMEKAVEVLYGELFGERTNRQMPLPTSLLLDSSGRLSVVYFGQLNVDQLLSDVRVLEEEKTLPPLDVLSHGRRLVYSKRNFAQLAKRMERAGLPALGRYYRQVDRETQTYFFEDGVRRVIRQRPAPVPAPEQAGVEQARVEQAGLQEVDASPQGASASRASVSESSR